MSFNLTMQEILEICKRDYKKGTVFKCILGPNPNEQLTSTGVMFISGQAISCHTKGNSCKLWTVYNQDKGFAPIIKHSPEHISNADIKSINKTLKLIEKYTNE